MLPPPLSFRSRYRRQAAAAAAATAAKLPPLPPPLRCAAASAAAALPLRCRLCRSLLHFYLGIVAVIVTVSDAVAANAFS